jgi:DNA helicase-2/ATP-dependent DNA helicase PcrA
MKADDVRNFLLNDLYYLPLYSRIPSIKKLLSTRLKKELVSIVEEVEDHYETLINKLRNTALPTEEKREILGELMEERQQKIESLKRSSKTAVAKYIALFPKHDVMYHYTDLVSNPERLQPFGNNLLDGKFLAYFCNHNTELLNKNCIEFEDLTGILYLQHKIFGLKKEMKIKYVVIDEAQDFSVFQINVLKEILNTEMFTMLGDLAQGIHSYRGINNWNEVMEKVFTNGNCRYLTLEQSYRTTIEIMDVANAVIKMSQLPDLVLAKPVVRHGAKPRIFRLATPKEMLNVLQKRVQQLRAKHYDTIAIICKTANECALLKKMVDKRGSLVVKQLSADDLSYEGGIVIVSAYHAKGLEFDAVIIAALEEDYPVKELDLKLLYVAMTRALHSLDIICCGSTLTCLEDMNEGIFLDN